MESGENEEIEEIMNDEEMYFKEPAELIEFFNNLEESNLFNIQNSHIAEQKFQELRVRAEEKKAELKAAHEQHKEQRRQLERQLGEFEAQIDTLRRKKNQNSLIDEKDNKDIKATITQEYDGLKELMGSKEAQANYLPDLESRNSEPLSLLSVTPRPLRPSRSAWSASGRSCASATPRTPNSSRTS